MYAPRIKALIVDDHDDAAASLRALLVANGCDAEICCECCSCVEHAKRLHPDLVLIDVAMTSVDGCEIAGALRRNYPERFLLIGFDGEHPAKFCGSEERSTFDEFVPKIDSGYRLQSVVAKARDIARA